MKKTLHVQDYLRSGKSYEDLHAEHGVHAKPYNGKVSFTYDMLEAKDDNPLACQCRGLILREDTLEAVAVPFFRFFNSGQEAAVDIDWNTARFENKMDGTLLIVYWDVGGWMCATRSMCEAHGQIDDSDVTFAKLADMFSAKHLERKGIKNGTLHGFMKQGHGRQGESWKQKTFCFELCSPFNRIVCQYDELSLTLLGVRDIITFEEHHPHDFAKELGVPIPEELYFNNINHLIQVIRDWDPKEREGVVVKDANFNRIKVKNPSYVIFNKMRDSLSASWRGCVEVVLLGTEDDVIPMMPELIAQRIIKLKPLVAEVLRRTQQDYDELKNIQDMKTFALAAKERMWSAALFALKREKTSDLKTFALGNNRNEERGKASIPKPALETMLELCRKLDPECTKIELQTNTTG